MRGGAAREGSLSLASRAASWAARDPELRVEYLRAALPMIARLLSSVDRHPYRATYGCFDRQYWHYRTAAFPSEMYQEAVWPLALVYRHELPGNAWRGSPLVRELAIAGLRFSARAAHRDGSCDDYYPYERALGAAAFSLVAAAKAYRLLELDDAEIRDSLARRARWIANHGETGRLTNHHALAALGMWHTWSLTGNEQLRAAARGRLAQVLAAQSAEGWFDEYGGADSGYQTLAIECLAELRKFTADATLDEPLRRAVDFARRALHADDTLGGPYNSRGTRHFYAYGFELLAGQSAQAADLADANLRSLQSRAQAGFDDDRMVGHRPGTLIEAYLAWSPRRPAAEPDEPGVRFFPEARWLVARSAASYTVVSAARGGAFRRDRDGRRAQIDSGVVIELADGRQGVTQRIDAPREISMTEGPRPRLTVSARFDRDRQQLASVARQAALHLGMASIGRWLRTPIRWLLQRLLIGRRGPLPVWHLRTFEFDGDDLTVRDTIRLLDARVRVRRLAIATDYQAAYTAAAGFYHSAASAPWIDWSGHVDELNRRREVTIERLL